MSKNKKVDLFLVGAAKCGTSSLVDYFGQKSCFFIPEMKEPFYFIDENIGVTSDAEYIKLYERSKSQHLLVDASTGYLFDEHSCQKIYEYNPDAKILILIRDPVKMVCSLYNYMKVDGIEVRDIEFALYGVDNAFTEKVKSNDFGWRENYNYIERAKYTVQIERYLNKFKNVKVVVFEDLIMKPDVILPQIERFLGIKFYSSGDQLPKSNIGGKTNSKLIHFFRNKRYPLLRKIVPIETRAWFRKRLRELNTSRSEKFEIESSLKLRLQITYKKEICDLESLLSIDLSNWKINGEQP